MSDDNLVEKYVFGAKNTKTKDGYQIEFLNMPKLFAKGETYEETVYYSYRVLSNFLMPFAGDKAKINRYTLHQMTTSTPSEDTFYSLITATDSLDPHKMNTSFILPQTTADHLETEAGSIKKIINYQNIF